MQSSALLLLAAEGRIPAFDAAIFADTGWEPAAVYRHLHRLTRMAEQAGIAVVRVHKGHVRRDALDPTHRFASMPLYTLGPAGQRGMARRQCTAEYKLKPIKAEVLRQLGYPHPSRVPASVFAEMAIGISADEWIRARGADVRYMRNVFPLLDLGWSRTDCLRYLAGHGLAGTPKSSCVGCLIWNLISVRSSFMTLIKWSRFPLVAADEYARRWLQFTANIGRAANTVDAYGRAIEDHLRFCRLVGALPVTLRADVVAAWIADMEQRPLQSQDGDEDDVVEIGLSNATIQQRVVAVRSFYDYLVEDGLRERNPVRRGQSGRRGLHGAYRDAISELEHAAGRYAAAGGNPAVGQAHYERGEALRVRGEYDAAEAAYAEAAAFGHPAQPGRALLWLARGRPDAASAAIHRVAAEVQDPVHRSQILPAAVDVLVEVGEIEDAASLADQLCAFGSSFGCTALQAAGEYARASVAVARAEAEDALAAARSAAGAWARLSAPYEVARCRVLIGRALRLLGDAESAVADLAEARRAFAGLGAAPAEHDVAVLLGDARAPGGLSPREIEVLRLVAAGKSNPEIAVALVLSEKTVARHLSNIFAKLDVGSRTAAAAFAFEHHLV